MPGKFSFRIAACALLLPFATLHAQRIAELSPGTRVRISAAALDAEQRSGKIVSATADTIQFRADAFPVTRTFAVADLQSIEVSAGKDSRRGRDALYGLGIGGAVGAAAGLLSYKKPAAGCWIMCESRGGDAVAGALVGGAMGALVGAFVVGNVDKTERWVTIKDSNRISLVPLRGTPGLAVSYSF